MDQNNSLTGIIIATAAVFEIHIDTNMVTTIKPKFNLKSTQTKNHADAITADQFRSDQICIHLFVM